jgi:hypothetical protein
MKSGTDELLDHVDEWKFKLHKKLKGLSAAERKAFWMQVHESARKRGLNVADTEALAKSATKPRRTA